jgi:hypothetical protein
MSAEAIASTLPDSAVEEQDPLSTGRVEARLAGPEAPPIRLREDGERQAVGNRMADNIAAPVCRPVVDDDQVGIESAALDGRDESVDGRGKLQRLVVHGHDNGELALGKAHPPTLTASGSRER